MKNGTTNFEATENNRERRTTVAPISNSNRTASRVEKILLLALGIAIILAAGAPLRANDSVVMKFHDGAMMESFTVYPLFYGNWAKSDEESLQKYMAALAAYMSGGIAPPGQLPVTWQYGVRSVAVAPYQASTEPSLSPHLLTENELLSIVHVNQTPKTILVCQPPVKPGLPPVCHTQIVTPAKLPAYNSKELILIVLSPGYSVDCGGCNGRHDSENAASYYAYAQPSYSLLDYQYEIAHEVFEAATDPAYHIVAAWNGIDSTGHTDELSDGCNGIYIPSVGQNVAMARDNTNGGACNGTGYVSRPFPRPAVCGVMKANQALIGNTAEESLQSCDGRFALRLSNESLILTEYVYVPFAGTFPVNIWGTNSYTAAIMAVMQADGNLVLYRGFKADPANAIWSTNTWGHPGAYLVVQNDGNLVVYDAGGKALWASDTCCR